MSAADAIRADLAERRDALSRLQRELGEVEVAVGEAQAAMEAAEQRLQKLRQSRDVLSRQVRKVEEEARALGETLAFLAERMPVPEGAVETSGGWRPPPEQRSVAGDVEVRPARKPRRETMAGKILQEAEALDLSNVSQRSRERATAVREVLAAADGPLSQSEIAEKLLETRRDLCPSEAKALTGVYVGLTLLRAEQRVRCVNSIEETWALTAPERASGNLGIRLGNFAGRTTRWPKDDARTPPPGSRIVIEEGSYESRKGR